MDISEIVNRIAPKVGGARGVPWPSLFLPQLSVCPSICLHVSFSLSGNLSVSLSVPLFLPPPVHLSPLHLSLKSVLCLAVFLSLCLSHHLYALSVHLSVPQHGRPEVVEPTLQRWIGDSAAIPCTPDVQAPKAKKKSPRWVPDCC